VSVIEQIATRVGTGRACQALGLPPATYYRWRKPAKPRCKASRPRPARALAENEQARVLEVLNAERFVDKTPHEVHAMLLDEGRWYCSVRTMYRILAQAGELRERRDQLRHPAYARPELLATGPNQVWSWDITKLRAAAKWTYYYLYVILDIFSRFVVGWMLAHRESGPLASLLLEETCGRQGVERGELVVHADRGSAPKSKTLAHKLADLGVEASFSRPRVSNDNPYSESQFRTLKYQPSYPKRFGSFEDARAYCREFFDWYNHEHRHSGIAMLTPAIVHAGNAEHVLAERQRVLDQAYQAHPERFVGGRPLVPRLPEAVWINPPEDKRRTEIELH